jgi:hypothetical protein
MGIWIFDYSNGTETEPTRVDNPPKRAIVPRDQPQLQVVPVETTNKRTTKRTRKNLS